MNNAYTKLRVLADQLDDLAEAILDDDADLIRDIRLMSSNLG